jgi:hypothetical protein
VAVPTWEAGPPEGREKRKKEKNKNRKHGKEQKEDIEIENKEGRTQLTVCP